MTNLNLVEVDPNPGFIGLPEGRKILAVSTSYSALCDYCTEKFGAIPNEKEQFKVYYVIEPSSILIVPETNKSV